MKTTTKKPSKRFIDRITTKEEEIRFVKRGNGPSVTANGGKKKSKE